MKPHLIQIFIFAILLLSCKKEEISKIDHVGFVCDTIWNYNPSYDTIYPNAYLNYWPGSWWEFDNGHTEYSNSWEFFPLVQKTHDVNGCPIYDIDTVIVPKVDLNIAWNSWDGYDYILDKNLRSLSKPSAPYAYWSDSNSEWTVGTRTTSNSSYSTKYTMTREKIEFLDSLTVPAGTFYNVYNVDCWTSATFSGPGVPGFGPSYHQRLYYALDIGLVRYEYGYDQIEDTTELINYYIAPH